MQEKHHYQRTMDSIQPPASLKNKVLTEIEALQQTASPDGSSLVVSESITKKRFFRPAVISLGGAAAAACLVALALIIGAPAGVAGTGAGASDAFSLYAYATEPHMRYAQSDDLVLFGAMGQGSSSEEEGMYTGCLFNIEGEGITRVDMELSRGGIYLYTETMYPYDKELMTAAGRNGLPMRNAAIAEAQEILGGEHTHESETGEANTGDEHILALGRLMGDSVSVKCGSDEGSINLDDVSFGLWVAPEDQAPEEVWTENLRRGWHQSVASFDEQTLRVAVHKADGTQSTQSYLLKAAKMKIEQAQDGTITVLPELAGEDESYTYAIYGIVAS